MTGALLAFGAIVAFTFDSLVVDESQGSEIPVPSMLHLVATLGTLVVGYLLAVAVRGSSLPAVVGFGLVGFQVTLLYNPLLPVRPRPSAGRYDAGPVPTVDPACRVRAPAPSGGETRGSDSSLVAWYQKA